MPTAAELFRQKVSGSKDPRMKSEGEFNVQYPSGFLTLDFANGCKVNVVPEDGRSPFSYYSVGITDGAAFELVGKPGCGKTTLAVQIAARITERFEWSSIFHDDIEGGVSEVRKRVLTGWTEDMMEDKYRYRNTGITSENFYESITTLKEVKLANKDSIMYDTGVCDYKGHPVMKMQPDVYILDSAAMLIPEKFSEEEELSGLDEESKKEMLEVFGLKESGLDTLIKKSYDLLGLMSFLTAGKPEVRAWTIKKGTTAPVAAGKIHSDIQRGFIKAEIVSYDDLIKEGSMVAAKEKGLVRSEGKDYIMQDGDIVLFKFNV